MERLRRCLPAARRLEEHEEDLLRSGIIGGPDNPLPFLEKRLLDLATSGACLGVCLGLFFTHGDVTFARLIQHGCLQGRLFSTFIELYHCTTYTCSS
jgi:hypothetical protein